MNLFFSFLYKPRTEQFLHLSYRPVMQSATMAFGNSNIFIFSVIFFFFCLCIPSSMSGRVETECGLNNALPLTTSPAKGGVTVHVTNLCKICSASNIVVSCKPMTRTCIGPKTPSGQTWTFFYPGKASDLKVTSALWCAI